jgi:hypothetical protein
MGKWGGTMYKVCSQIRSSLIIFMAAIVSVGCLKSPNQQAIDTERLLAASGFKMRLADTPEKLAHIKELAQRQILTHRSKGELLYVYVDAEHCQCVYAGSKEAYRRYESLARQKKLADENQLDASRSQPKEMDWGEWRFNQTW